MSGSRNKLCSLIILLLLAQTQHTTTAAPWSSFEVVLNKFMENTSFLVVFHEFGYASEFFKSYPSQQILSNPDRYFKTCPFPRMLVVSGLNYKFFQLTFHYGLAYLCPFGTVYVLAEDVQLYAYNQFVLLPYSALNDPARKGLFAGTSLNSVNWKKHTAPKVPPTWTEKYLSEEAQIVSIDAILGNVLYLYEVVFRVGNYNMESLFTEFRYNPDLPPVFNTYALPPLGTDSPTVIAVYKPQQAVSITAEYLSNYSVMIPIFVFGLVLALFLHFHFQQKGTNLSPICLTLVSLISVVSLKNLKGDLKLVITFGVWLFLSQIFISVLQGDVIKNVSLGPRDKIISLKVCEPAAMMEKTIDVDHSFSGKADRVQASAKLLEYEHACFFDILGMKPFLAYFERKYPKAEVYHIKHREDSKKVFLETYWGSKIYNFKVCLRQIFRVRICPVRGYFYIAKLLEAGMLDGVKYHHQRAPPRPEFTSWKAFYNPKVAYESHVKLLKEVGHSAAESEFVDYVAWIEFAGSGWLCATVAFFFEVLVGARRVVSEVFSAVFGFLKTKPRTPTRSSIHPVVLKCKVRRTALAGGTRLAVVVVSPRGNRRFALS